MTATATWPSQSDRLRWINRRSGWLFLAILVQEHDKKPLEQWLFVVFLRAPRRSRHPPRHRRHKVANTARFASGWRMHAKQRFFACAISTLWVIAEKRRRKVLQCAQMVLCF